MMVAFAITANLRIGNNVVLFLAPFTPNDEATLALMAERLSLSDIQGAFKKYTKRDLPRYYTNLKRLASDQAGHKPID